MSAREMLKELLDDMPEDRVREVADFAAFLRWREERAEWREYGQTQLARAYGPDEPDYSLADIKRGSKP